MFDKDDKIKKELVSQALEHLKNRKEILPSMLIESNAPDGSKCPSCHKETLKIKRMPLSGAYSGGIYCFSCDFRDSVIGYLGKQMVQVQPMPQGAEQIYLKDPEDEAMNSMFEYSTCQICYKPIMRQPTAPKPSWFHIPSWEYEQPDHKPKVNE